LPPDPTLHQEFPETLLAAKPDCSVATHSPRFSIPSRTTSEFAGEERTRMEPLNWLRRACEVFFQNGFVGQVGTADFPAAGTSILKIPVAASSIGRYRQY
jgi:hypothetical protein